MPIEYTCLVSIGAAFIRELLYNDDVSRRADVSLQTDLLLWKEGVLYLRLCDRGEDAVLAYW